MTLIPSLFTAAWSLLIVARVEFSAPTLSLLALVFVVISTLAKVGSIARGAFD